MAGDPAFPRWLAITFTRLAGTAGAVFGVVLLGRAETTVPRLVGVALVLASLWMIATVPRAMAAKWRSPR